MKLDEQVARKYLALKESAKARGKPFSLTLTSIRNLKKEWKGNYMRSTD